MRLLFVFLAAILCHASSSVFAADSPAVKASESAQYEGKVATVYGRVIEVRRVANGPIIFEFDGRPTAPNFRALVYPMAGKRFGSDPENVYLGQIAEVTGAIVVRKDLPQTWISDPSQIRLHKAANTEEAQPSPSPTASQ